MGDGSNDIVLQLIQEVRDNSVKMAEVVTEVKNISIVVDGLSKVVKDGNGSSLVTRMALAEGDIQDNKRAIEASNQKAAEAQDKINNSSDEDKKAKRDKKNTRLQFWGSVIPGLLGLAAGILALIYG
jgi:hypothetical protein